MKTTRGSSVLGQSRVVDQFEVGLYSKKRTSSVYRGILLVSTEDIVVTRGLVFGSLCA